MLQKGLEHNQITVNQLFNKATPIAYEHALLSGQTKRASRDRATPRLRVFSCEARFAFLSRITCLQAKQHPKVYS